MGAQPSKSLRLAGIDDLNLTLKEEERSAIRIAYVIYNERPDSGLIVGQVVSLLRQIKLQAPRNEITLVAIWQPWVAYKYRAEISNLEKLLRGDGIDMTSHATAIIPSRYFLYQPKLLWILQSWATLILRYALGRKFDVVHCRSYLPSYIAARLKHRAGFRVIFDMRSLWPKEHVTIGVWKETDDAYKMWQEIERYTLQAADAAVVVSQPMLEIVQSEVPSSHAHLIPICVDTAKFRFDPLARVQRRAELGWQEGSIVVYQGSLGLMNSNIAEVAEYLALIGRTVAQVRFLILTSNRTVDIQAVLAEHGIASSQYAIRHPSRSELPEWLSAADAGIHAMSPGPDSATRMGVKVVEYLSCGLPLILNRHVGAAAAITREYGVGLVIDVAAPDDAAHQLADLFVKASGMRERCGLLAREMFSVEACARAYLSLYRALYDQKPCN